MSRRYKGGVISATAPTTSTSAATGVWTLPQQMQAIVGSGWPSQKFYWIGILGDASSNYAQSVAFDSSGNVGLCGYSANASDDIQVAKYNASGVIQWQSRLYTASADGGTSCAFDASGNLYVCGYTTIASRTYNLVAKYDGSGTLQWQRTLGDASVSTYATSITIDTSGNLYVGGASNYGTSTDFILSKYNSSGTLQFQKAIGNTSRYDVANSIYVDSSENIYLAGTSNDNTVTTYVGFAVVKCDSSGNLLWSKKLGGDDAFEQGTAYGVVVDSGGNVYVCGRLNNGSSAAIQLVKYNSSGTLQWQRSLNGSGADNGYGIAIDSSSNIYVVGDGTATVGYLQIAKYNSSGTIQWQRKLGSTTFNCYGYGIAVDATGNMYVSGISTASGSVDFLFAKLLTDGSLTGTYSVGAYSFTYSASTLTDAATSWTGSTPTYSSSTSTLVDAAGSLTNASTSLTSTVTTL